MGMARATAELISSTLKHSCGLPVECVIADSCIGGFAEAAECAEKFSREGVGVSLTVTPCWCYGSETMDMDPLIPKAIWGFNGSDRPGAVYLAATLAGHSQKGLPCFAIYGRDVQDLGDLTIPKDVRENLLRFAKAGIAAATMKGKAYLAMGGVSMGIAGSIVDQDFFQSYLGMRVETIDMTEFLGRMNKGVYDHEEFDRALAWTKANCNEGADYNANQRTRAQKDQDWESSVKMALIARDLMVGNPKLAEMGYKEQARGRAMRSPRAFKVKGSGRITSPTATSWKRSFAAALIGTVFESHMSSPPRVRCYEQEASMLLGHLLTYGDSPGCSATSGPTGRLMLSSE